MFGSFYFETGVLAAFTTTKQKIKNLQDLRYHQYYHEFDPYKPLFEKETKKQSHLGR